MDRRPLSLRALTTGFLAVWLVAAFFPFAWTVWGSFKVEADFFSRQSWWFAIEGIRTQIADRRGLHARKATEAPGSTTNSGGP